MKKLRKYRNFRMMKLGNKFLHSCSVEFWFLNLPTRRKRFRRILSCRRSWSRWSLGCIVRIDTEQRFAFTANIPVGRSWSVADKSLVIFWIAHRSTADLIRKSEEIKRGNFNGVNKCRSREQTKVIYF